MPGQNVDPDRFGSRSVHLQANIGNVTHDFSQYHFVFGYNGFIRLSYDCGGDSRLFLRELSKRVWTEIQCKDQTLAKIERRR